MNVFRLFSKMGGQQVESRSSGEIPLDEILQKGVRNQPDVAALACMDNGRLSVMLWHYHDDDLPGPDAEITLEITGLQSANGTLQARQFRIDATHSNAFTAWKQMGSPFAPNDKQYAQLVAAGQLAEAGAPQPVSVTGGRASVKITLPRQAVALLVLEKGSGSRP